MQRIIGLFMALGLASGLLGAFAYDQLGSDAGAAPAAQPVREQNLDTGGRIRVHEQGTANVNVTNGSLPVSGTVNVGNLPAPKTAVLYEGPINPSDLIVTPFVDVAGCGDFTIFVSNSSGGGGEVGAQLILSADGVTAYASDVPAIKTFHATPPGGPVNTTVRFTTGLETVNSYYGTGFIGAFAPFAGAYLSAPSTLPARNIKVTLFCV